MVPQVDAGKVRAIAITGDTRSPNLPDVPTLAEVGLASAESSGWFGLMAPAGTPQAIIDTLHRAVVETAKAPDVLKALDAQGVQPMTNSPAELAAYIADTLERYRKVVKEEGLKFE
jgi:tripartite-type tricarboxylate transporter receptor subunit TctC